MATCGNCKHWDRIPGHNEGKCEFPIPFWMRNGPFDFKTLRDEGRDCTCWAPKRRIAIKHKEKDQ